MIFNFLKQYKKILILILILALSAIGILFILYNQKTNSALFNLTTINLNEPLVPTHDTPVQTGSFLASTKDLEEVGVPALTTSYIDTALTNPNTNFLLNYNTTPTYTKSKSNIWFENIEGNKYQCQIVIVNTDNEVIYVSPLLSPNKHINNIETLSEFKSDLTVHCLLFSTDEQDRVVKGVQSFILKLK